jgi:hypothetical protein
MKKKLSSEEEPLLQESDDNHLQQSSPSSNNKSASKKFNLGREAFGTSGRKSPSKPFRSQKQPNRTTKISQKLVVFPESNQPDTQVTDLASDFGDSDEKVVSYPLQIAKEKEAERLSRVDKQELPRVTAYCTAKYIFVEFIFIILKCTFLI